MTEVLRSIYSSRFRNAFRKRWWIVPGVATVVVALAMLAFPARTTAQADLVFRDPAELQLASQINQTPLTFPRKAVTELAAFLTGEAYEADLKKSIPNAKLVVSTVSPPGGMHVSVSASSRKGSIAALQHAISALKELRQVEAKAALSGAMKIVAARSATLKTRYDELTSELEGIPASDGLATAVGTERLKVRDQLDAIDRTLDAVRLVVEDKNAGVETLNLVTPTTETGGFKPIKTAILTIFGAIVGFGALLASAMFDRRIRSRTDVEKVAGSGSLAATVERDQRNLMPFALAIRHAALLGAGDGKVILVPAAGNSDQFGTLRTLAQAINELPPINGSDTGALDSRIEVVASAAYPASDGLTAGLEASAVFLVVAYGETHADDLSSTIQGFAGAGIPLSGVVLAGVPTDEIRSANR